VPLYYYKCDGLCKQVIRRILPPDKSNIEFPCKPDCGGIMRRAPRPPSTNVVERLDSGFMPRAIERPADAERLYHERAHKPPSED
jgi:hypothetical protein